MLTVRDPYTGDLLAELPHATSADLASALSSSACAYERWRKSSSHERARVLNDVAAAVEAASTSFVDLVRAEAGKPVRSAELEVRRTISVLRWAAGEAVRFSGELVRIDTESYGRPGFGIHTRFPRGVILGITPYNWPLLLMAHKVAPAVACGCSIVVKPSPLTPLSALRLADAFRAAGAPEGLVQVALADDAGSASLTRAPEIAMVSFTGSDRVGKLVRAQAVDRPVTLELGGNAWAAVLDDVAPSALPAIARRLATAGYGYAGQSCISVQNVAVARPLREALVAALSEATEATPFGDTRDAEVVSGPLIHAAAAARVTSSLATASSGRAVVTSHRRVGGEGPRHLVPPTLLVLDALPNREPIVEDEIFGPVVTVSSFGCVDELIAQVNGGRYGLQAGVFTQHWPSIEALYRELRVGGVVVNDVPTARYDPQPYGGTKESGQGREGVRYAMEEMTESRFLALCSELVGLRQRP